MTDTNTEQPRQYTKDVERAGTGPFYPSLVSFAAQYDVGALHTCVNIFYFEGSATSYTFPMLTAAQTAFDGSWGNSWKNMTVAANRYLGSIVTDKGSISGLQVNNSTFTPISGLAGGTSMPDNTAYLLSLKTGTHYKGGHGRLYIPGVGSTFLNSDSNTVTAASITTINNAWSSLVTAMAVIPGAQGGPYNPVVWHRKLSFAPNTVDLITTAVCSSRLATQRRRLRKVPHH